MTIESTSIQASQQQPLKTDMRRIAHISDLHFGAEDPLIAAGLLDDLSRQAADLVVISGDLTQRARADQFEAARAFLEQIPVRQIVVPGNHDVPLYNVVHRLLRPLSRYRRYITSDLHPFYADEEIAVAGVNTARSATWKEGRISHFQIRHLSDRFRSVPESLFKVLVSHHPFIPPAGSEQTPLVGRARLALRTLEGAGCALILAGHLHRAYNGDVRPHHLEIKRSILVAQAGTAISHRRRDEPNAYNWITLEGDRLELEVRAWDGNRFAASSLSVFQRSEEGWITLRE